MKNILSNLILSVITCYISSCGPLQTISAPSTAKNCKVISVIGGANIICPDGSSQFVSNGSKGDTGPTGPSGHNSLVTSQSADVSLCINGGNIISVGTDLNNDTILENSEVSGLAVVCNGLNGAPAPITPVSTVALVQPCASNPNDPSPTDLLNPNLETFFKLSSGVLIGTVSQDVQGDYTHLGAVVPNMTWMSTGIGSNCLFSVDSQGVITQH